MNLVNESVVNGYNNMYVRGLKKAKTRGPKTWLLKDLIDLVSPCLCSIRFPTSDRVEATGTWSRIGSYEARYYTLLEKWCGMAKCEVGQCLGFGWFPTNSSSRIIPR
jgi:hypothetical protein